VEAWAVDYEDSTLDPQGDCESLPRLNVWKGWNMAWLGEIVEVTYFPDSGAVGSLACNTTLFVSVPLVAKNIHPWKLNMVHLKISPWKFGDSELGKPSFSGSMLNFGGGSFACHHYWGTTLQSFYVAPDSWQRDRTTTPHVLSPVVDGTGWEWNMLGLTWLQQ